MGLCGCHSLSSVLAAVDQAGASEGGAAALVGPGLVSGFSGEVTVTPHKTLTGEPGQASVCREQSPRGLHFDAFATEASIAQEHRRGHRPLAGVDRRWQGLRKDEPAGAQLPFFIDWLTIAQRSSERLPIVSNGLVLTYDQHGELVYKVVKGFQHKGSHDTSIQIRSDGEWWSVSGNLSRFNRPDNLFGYDLAQCVRLSSALAAQFGLPAFTPGHSYPRAVKMTYADGSSQVVERSAWTGARIRRVDLTANYATGSAEAARDYLRWLSSQQESSRMKVGTYPDGQTVDFGRGSRRWYGKAYNKGDQLLRIGAPPEVIDYCNVSGAVRYELTVKSTQLQTMGCEYLGGVSMGRLIEFYTDKASVLTRAEFSTDDLDQLPPHYRLTGLDYLRGADVVRSMSPATYKRHRKALLPFGIDIAVPSNVRTLAPRTRTIFISPMAMPEWYVLPEVA